MRSFKEVLFFQQALEKLEAQRSDFWPVWNIQGLNVYMFPAAEA